MTRSLSATIRLLGVTLALAAGIAGLGSTGGPAPAHPVIVTATSIVPLGH